MSGLDALQSVQLVTVDGKHLVVLDGDDWDTLIDRIETLEDAQAARQALADLHAAGGDRAKAGWLRWDDVEDQRGSVLHYGVSKHAA
jgi:hypothetical protein